MVFFSFQGHLNDTIVVNQPRLTTEDDQVITISDGNVELLVDETENDQVGKKMSVPPIFLCFFILRFLCHRN